MKSKILLLSALAGILYSCGSKGSDDQKEDTNKEYVVLEGNIKTNGGDTEDLYLLVDPLAIENNIVKKIFLDKEGNFKDSIQHIKEGYYILMNGDKTVNLYLKDGDVVNVKTNALSNESFLDSLHVKGNTESVFLTDYERFKLTNFDSNLQDLFSLDETAFKAKLDSLKQRSITFVDQYKALPDSAKKVAKDDILYGWGLVLNSYPMAHAQIKQDRNYRPSDSYYDFTQNLSVNDEGLFKNNAKYRNYVIQELNRRMAKDYKPSQEEDQIDYFIKKLKQDSIVPYIKDFMLVQLANQGVFQPAPTYEQYQRNVLQTVQAQIQAFKKKNPNVQIPASATPTKEQIQNEYANYINEYNSFYDKNYQKIIENVGTPEFKKILEENNLVIKGLKKGDPAPKIEIIKDGEVANLIDLNKGKNLLVYFWSTSSENTSTFFEDYSKLVETFASNPSIAFATVNIDLANKKDKWDLTLKEKKVKGDHYFAADDWDTGFIKSYGFDIRPFPRFIIINSEGNIYDFDAPTPKEDDLKGTLTELISTK